MSIARESVPSWSSSAERSAEQQAFVASLGQAALAGAPVEELFSCACEGVRSLLDMDRSSVYEVSGDRSALLFRTGLGWNDAVSGFVQSIPVDGSTPPAVAYQSGTAVVLGDYPASRFAKGIVQQIGAASGVSVPIGHFGALSTHSLTPRPVSVDDASFVTSVANVLAAAIDHRDRQAELANRARTQHLLAELGRDLLRAGRSEFLRESCVAVARALGTDLVIVLAADHAKARVTVKAEYGYPEWLQGRSFDTAESGCANWTLTHSGASVIHDVDEETRFRPHSISTAAGARSGICVAIPGADRSWGVIVTYSRTKRTFAENDVDFLTSVAHLLSAAIERRRAKEKLERQRLELQELIDNAPDIIGRLAADSTVLFVNDALKVTGLAPEDVVGRRLDELGLPRHTREAWMQAIAHVVESERRHIVELDAINDIRLEVRFVPEFEGERVTSVLAIARDVTEQRRAAKERHGLELQLEQAKRVASIGRLGTTVAHEFNNVLMSISPFAEVIERSCREHPSILRAAQCIRTAIARGRRVTQEIMRFARPAQPARESVNLAKWLPDTVQCLRPSLGELDVRVDVPECDVHANLDRQQMEQVLTNLLVNARDALAGRRDGRVAVDLRHDGKSNVAHIVIRDNGCGMPPEVAALIFEPFFTTKRSGTGLGLPVVKQIVECHGGSIGVVTENGSGTTFNVVLPMSASF